MGRAGKDKGAFQPRPFIKSKEKNRGGGGGGLKRGVTEKNLEEDRGPHCILNPARRKKKKVIKKETGGDKRSWKGGGGGGSTVPEYVFEGGENLDVILGKKIGRAWACPFSVKKDYQLPGKKYDRAQKDRKGKVIKNPLSDYEWIKQRP